MDSMCPNGDARGRRRVVDSRLFDDVLQLDEGQPRVNEPKVLMEREGAKELRARLLRMILRNEQLRKAQTSSTTI